jgi:hypothetical protein
MLQMLHLNVLKVDRVLHMKCAWEAASSASDIQGDAGDEAARAHCWCTRLRARCAERSLAPCAVTVSPREQAEFSKPMDMPGHVTM